MKTPLLPITLAALTCSCASIVSKSEYPVTINTSPSGASVSITNEDGMVVHRSVTPTTVTLPADHGFFDGSEYLLTAALAGYPSVTQPLKAKIDGWYFANILFGGLIGWLIVDPATGAMWRLDGDVFLDLEGGLPADARATAVADEPQG